MKYHIENHKKLIANLSKNREAFIVIDIERLLVLDSDGNELVELTERVSKWFETEYISKIMKDGNFESIGIEKIAEIRNGWYFVFRITT